MKLWCRAYAFGRSVPLRGFWYGWTCLECDGILLVKSNQHFSGIMDIRATIPVDSCNFITLGLELMRLSCLINSPVSDAIPGNILRPTTASF